MNKKTKVWLVVAALLILIGVIVFGGVMSMLNWDFTKLSTVKLETNSYDINEEYKNISIITETSNVEFVPSKDAATLVVCHEHENAQHSVLVTDGTLVIKIENNKKWYEFINVSFDIPKITLYIPQREYGDICVKTSTGNIELENISSESVDISVSTGRIALCGVECVEKMSVAVSTGKVSVGNTRCDSFISKGSTGNISLENVIVEDRLDIERSTGSVELEHCDAGQLSVITKTGGIKGSLLSEKLFVAESNTGSIDVPATTSGGRCELRTNTGSIKIELE